MPKVSKSKSKDQRPARQRYWARRRLEVHKAFNLMRCNGMTAKGAVLYWREVRKNRIPTGFIQ